MDLKLNRGRGKGKTSKNDRNIKQNEKNPVNNNIIKQYFSQSNQGVSAFDQYASNHTLESQPLTKQKINTVHTNLNLPDEYLFTPPPSPPHQPHYDQPTYPCYDNNNYDQSNHQGYNDNNYNQSNHQDYNDNYMDDDYSLTSPKSNHDQNDSKMVLNSNESNYNVDTITHSNYQNDQYDPTAPEMTPIVVSSYGYPFKKMTYGKWKARQIELNKWASIFVKRYYLQNEEPLQKYTTWVKTEWKKWRADFLEKTSKKELSLDRHQILYAINPDYMNVIEYERFY